MRAQQEEFVSCKASCGAGGKFQRFYEEQKFYEAGKEEVGLDGVKLAEQEL